MPTYSPLLTDQYQLVMAYNYWKLGLAEQEAIFHLSFRMLPLQSLFMVAAGLERIIEFLRDFKFTASDLTYLEGVENGDGALFSGEFLTYLSNLTFTCDLDGVPEGTIVYAKEPVLRIKGPILQCQLLETPLLNFINFATLIATKASQVYLAAQDDPVIEFGLRRAQGPDGGLTASRSAYIGGCSATSNVLAGKLYDIPINGTQAHSWIMAFPSELEAFQKFATIMKSNTVLLVDTYDTLNGIKHAIETAKLLAAEKETLAAIRLDSGDLLELSRKARNLLDNAGLSETKIIASGDLDEHVIRTLKENNAPIDSWGVGTRLVTSHDQPSLNAIYKLTALKNISGEWDYKIKLSNDPQKSTIPGILQTRRLFEHGLPVEDIIYDIELGEELFKTKKPHESQDLLQTIFQKGVLTYTLPNIHQIRSQTLEQVKIHSSFALKPYPVSLGQNLQLTIEKLLEKIKKMNA
ncbi:MAG: nicotinate phosphoribosyltransferase [Gammaproteobacteria bacterium]|nr:nicotinate phosphoribosyltransferase [Gammaproteobacteria bacterium]